MCPKFHKAIRAYAQGNVQGEAKRRLELHFALCEGCLREYTRITGRRLEQPVLGFETLEVETEYRYRRRLSDRAQALPPQGLSFRTALLFGAAGLLLTYLLASHSPDATSGRAAHLLEQPLNWLKSLIR